VLPAPSWRRSARENATHATTECAVGLSQTKYLRWALIEAAVHAVSSPVYRERYQRTAMCLGRQRGKKVARVDIARKLAEAIWYVLTRSQAFAPAGATTPLAA
jgi:hypothetical protein